MFVGLITCLSSSIFKPTKSELKNWHCEGRQELQQKEKADNTPFRLGEVGSGRDKYWLVGWWQWRWGWLINHRDDGLFCPSQHGLHHQSVCGIQAILWELFKSLGWRRLPALVKVITISLSHNKRARMTDFSFLKRNLSYSKPVTMKTIQNDWSIV